MINVIATKVQIDILNKLHFIILSNGGITMSLYSLKYIHNVPDIHELINRNIIITVFILLTFQIPDIRSLLCYIDPLLHLKVY